MNTAQRAFSEYSRLMSLLSWNDRLRFGARTFLYARACLQQRKLAPIDMSMHGESIISYQGHRLVIPFSQIDEAIGPGDSPTFSVIREMFANNVYLRAFRNHSANTVIDLGANRGFFMLIAKKIMSATVVVGVEPLFKYEAAFDIICQHNDLDNNAFTRIWRRVGSANHKDNISMPEILNSYSIDFVDFCKCDIEGGEFTVFLQNNEWLSKVGNVAMEVHQWAGDVSDIVDVMVDRGFSVLVTDQHLKKTNPETAAYLYASRTGNLISVSRS